MPLFAFSRHPQSQAAVYDNLDKGLELLCRLCGKSFVQVQDPLCALIGRCSEKYGFEDIVLALSRRSVWRVDTLRLLDCFLSTQPSPSSKLNRPLWRAVLAKVASLLRPSDMVLLDPLSLGDDLLSRRKGRNCLKKSICLDLFQSEDLEEWEVVLGPALHSVRQLTDRNEVWGVDVLETVAEIVTALIYLPSRTTHQDLSASALLCLQSLANCFKFEVSQCNLHFGFELGFQG